MPQKKRKTKSKSVIRFIEIRIQRYLFGRLLALSIEHNIDLEKTLSYPITVAPISLCHDDGTMHKTAKSVMVDVLKANTTDEEMPERYDAVIFDGVFLLHTLKNIPKTFGNISKKNHVNTNSNKCPSRYYFCSVLYAFY